MHLLTLFYPVTCVTVHLSRIVLCHIVKSIANYLDVITFNFSLCSVISSIFNFLFSPRYVNFKTASDCTFYFLYKLTAIVNNIKQKIMPPWCSGDHYRTTSSNVSTQVPCRFNPVHGVSEIRNGEDL